MASGFMSYKGECLVVAHDCGYPIEVVRNIQNAKTTDQLSHIMFCAMKGEFNVKN